MRCISQAAFHAILIFTVAPWTIASPVAAPGTSFGAPDTVAEVYFNVNSASSICATQEDKSKCQGAFKCDNANVEMECYFWVYDWNCTSQHPSNPWPGIRAGQSLTFQNVAHPIEIQNVTNSLDQGKIEAVWKYVDGYFGFGHEFVRGNCSGSAGRKCAYIMSPFTCK